MFEPTVMTGKTDYGKRVTNAYRSYLKAKSPKDKKYFLEIVNKQLDELFYRAQANGLFLAKMKWQEVWCIVAKSVRAADAEHAPMLGFYDIDPEVIVLPSLMGTDLAPPFELPKNGISVY